mgnify:CR=1 FL=1
MGNLICYYAKRYKEVLIFVYMKKVGRLAKLKIERLRVKRLYRNGVIQGKSKNLRY